LAGTFDPPTEQLMANIDPTSIPRNYVIDGRKELDR
jgi:hypothetical protein